MTFKCKYCKGKMELRIHPPHDEIWMLDYVSYNCTDCGSSGPMECYGFAHGTKEAAIIRLNKEMEKHKGEL